MSWHQTLADLRPQFQAHSLVKLYYVHTREWLNLAIIPPGYVSFFDQFDMSIYGPDARYPGHHPAPFDLDGSKIRLPPMGPPYPSRWPVLSESRSEGRCYESGKPARPSLTPDPNAGWEWIRRACLGNVDETTAALFLDLAGRAGRCVRCFTRNPIRSGGDADVWMDYVVYLSRLGVKDSPLTSLTTHLSPDRVLYYVDLATNVFDASVLAIDAILGNLGNLIVAPRDDRGHTSPTPAASAAEAPNDGLIRERAVDPAEEWRMRHPRARTTLALFDYMRDRVSATFQELADQVHGDAQTSDGTIRQNVARANDALIEMKIPFRFRVGSGRVVKQEQPGS